MKKILLSLLGCLLIPQVFACLILFLKDGKNVLFANHEDWYALDAEITFIPAHDKKLGIAYFDFASEKTAQGGINSAGLCFDGTRTPYAPFPDNNKKPSCNCYIWKKILEECSSTEEAVNYIKKFKIPEIEDVHLLFADKRGDAAIIGVYNGELQIHRRLGSWLLLTNFNPSNPSYGDQPPCERFARASSLLTQDSSATISNLELILSKTHQEDFTIYSNIYDLTAADIYIYQKVNYHQNIKLNLSIELAKGKHALRISTLFRNKP